MIPRPPEQNSVQPEIVTVVPTDILNTLQALKYDARINSRPMYARDFENDYKRIGIDLTAELAKRPKTQKEEQIKNDFLANKEGSFASNLAETLPLYANVEGRVGEYMQVKVTKTAKEDDQGNSFIDLIIEVKNNWIGNGAPKELEEEVPEKMTFLVDVTVNDSQFQNKIDSLESILLSGKRANVMCYRDQNGNVGIDRPKILVKQNGSNLEQFGTKLGECITRTASDRFTINRPDSFNRLYRAYFSDLMSAIGENAAQNSAYLKSQVPDKGRLALAREYDKIVKFVEIYKKTPITKSRTA
jgi:hypothetical protein